MKKFITMLLMVLSTLSVADSRVVLVSEYNNNFHTGELTILGSFSNYANRIPNDVYLLLRDGDQKMMFTGKGGMGTQVRKELVDFLNENCGWVTTKKELNFCTLAVTGVVRSDIIVADEVLVFNSKGQSKRFK